MRSWLSLPEARSKRNRTINIECKSRLVVNYSHPFFIEGGSSLYPEYWSDGVVTKMKLVWRLPETLVKEYQPDFNTHLHPALQ